MPLQRACLDALSGSSAPRLLATGLVRDPGAVPLVIGVAGHRDPRPVDLPVLRERFRSVLVQLHEHLPHTPLLMLNGLAAGMDSEAAEVFLELTQFWKQDSPREPLHQLVAALPKPRARYLTEDFPLGDTEQQLFERERLEHLLIRADAVLDGDNCPELSSDLLDPGALTVSQCDSHCYGRQGMFLVRHSYLLLAFSNGIDSGKIGGTSQTIAMQRGEVYPLFLHVDEVIAAREPGVVIEIMTPRIFDKQPVSAGMIRCWAENPGGSRMSSESIASLELPSVSALLSSTPFWGQLEAINSALWRLSAFSVQDLSPPTLLCHLADIRASAAKRTYLRLCRAVMLASVLLGLGISQEEWQAVGLLIVLAAVVLFPKLQQGPKLAFIQWRCLAESLSVLERWFATGVQVDAADLFRSQANHNFVWIRTILRSRRLQLMAQSCAPELRPSFSRAMASCQDWINGQEKWLSVAIERQKSLDQRYIAAGILGFGLALLLSVFYWYLGAGRIHSLWTEGLIGIAVACFGYRELMGYSDTNARYGRSRSQFARARAALDLVCRAVDGDAMLEFRLRLVVEAIGREKIDELNDWIGDQLQRVYSPVG